MLEETKLTWNQFREGLQLCVSGGEDPPFPPLWKSANRQMETGVLREKEFYPIIDPVPSFLLCANKSKSIGSSIEKSNERPFGSS